MPDGRIYAGISNDTGRKFYAAPEDIVDAQGNRLRVTLDEAEKVAEQANLDHYLGCTTWRVPPRQELEQLREAKDKGAFRETFNSSARPYHEHFYHSSSRYPSGSCAFAMRMHDGVPDTAPLYLKEYVRLVSGPAAKHKAQPLTPKP
jgi:hypothetical protein